VTRCFNRAGERHSTCTSLRISTETDDFLDRLLLFDVAAYFERGLSHRKLGEVRMSTRCIAALQTYHYQTFLLVDGNTRKGQKDEGFLRVKPGCRGFDEAVSLRNASSQTT